MHMWSCGRAGFTAPLGVGQEACQGWRSEVSSGWLWRCMHAEGMGCVVLLFLACAGSVPDCRSHGGHPQAARMRAALEEAERQRDKYEARALAAQVVISDPELVADVLAFYKYAPGLSGLAGHGCGGLPGRAPADVAAAFIRGQQLAR